MKRPKFAKTAKVLLAKVSAPKVLALLVTNYVQYPWNIKIQPRFFTDCPLSQFFFFFLIFCNTYEPHTLHKKLSFPVRISSVNVTKSSVPCGFGHIYWKILNGKLHFLCSDFYWIWFLNFNSVPNWTVSIWNEWQRPYLEKQNGSE